MTGQKSFFRDHGQAGVNLFLGLLLFSCGYFNAMVDCPLLGLLRDIHDDPEGFGVFRSESIHSSRAFDVCTKSIVTVTIASGHVCG